MLEIKHAVTRQLISFILVKTLFSQKTHSLLISVLLFQVDNVQSLMQCPSVLVCVGREPSHPSIVENFRKTSDDKLPKLSVRSRYHGCTRGHEGRRNGLLSRPYF